MAEAQVLDWLPTTDETASSILDRVPLIGSLDNFTHIVCQSSGTFIHTRRVAAGCRAVFRRLTRKNRCSWYRKLRDLHWDVGTNENSVRDNSRRANRGLSTESRPPSLSAFLFALFTATTGAVWLRLRPKSEGFMSLKIQAFRNGDSLSRYWQIHCQDILAHRLGTALSCQTELLQRTKMSKDMK